MSYLKLFPKKKDSLRPRAAYRLHGFCTLPDLYPFRYIRQHVYTQHARFPSLLWHVTCFGAKVHKTTPFSYRTQILRGDKTFTIKVSGAAVTVAGKHLRLTYILHGNSNPVASPRGVTTRRWWRVGFSDILALALVSANCSAMEKSTDRSSRHWQLTESISVNRKLPVGWGKADFSHYLIM
jgi:hypothetical protein